MGELTFENRPPQVTPASPVAPADKNFDDFRYQEEAQAQLQPGDPYRLDADHDGVACKDLPSRARYLSYGEAAAIARHTLAHQYGRTWTGGRKRVVCYLRTSYRTVGCRATWIRGDIGYRANVAVQKIQTVYRASAKIVSRHRM
jgi:hypothetical protein